MAIVSIITIVKNHGEGLKLTFESVQRQDFQDWEILVVAADSIDNTRAIADEMSKSDSRVKVLTQEGSGIYPAMNLGLEHSFSKYAWFLNAGDEFFSSQSLEQGVREIDSDEVGLVIGGYQVKGKSSNKVYVFPERKLKVFPFSFNRHGGCHQAMIFDTSSIKKINGFKLQYGLASDFDLVLRVIKDFGGKRVRVPLALIEPGGVADTNLNKVYSEKHQIRISIMRNPVMIISSKIWNTLAKLKLKLITQRTKRQLR